MECSLQIYNTKFKKKQDHLLKFHMFYGDAQTCGTSYLPFLLGTWSVQGNEYFSERWMVYCNKMKWSLQICVFLMKKEDYLPGSHMFCGTAQTCGTPYLPFLVGTWSVQGNKYFRPVHLVPLHWMPQEIYSRVNAGGPWILDAGLPQAWCLTVNIIDEI